MNIEHVGLNYTHLSYSNLSQTVWSILKPLFVKKHNVIPHMNGTICPSRTTFIIFIPLSSILTQIRAFFLFFFVCNFLQIFLLKDHALSDNCIGLVKVTWYGVNLPLPLPLLLWKCGLTCRY